MASSGFVARRGIPGLGKKKPQRPPNPVSRFLRSEGKKVTAGLRGRESPGRGLPQHCSRRDRAVSEGKGTPEGCPSVCPSVRALICPHRPQLPPGSTPPRCAGGAAGGERLRSHGPGPTRTTLVGGWEGFLQLLSRCQMELTQSGGWLWSVLGTRHSPPDPWLSLGAKMLKAPRKIPGITRSLLFLSFVDKDTQGLKRWKVVGHQFASDSPRHSQTHCFAAEKGLPKLLKNLQVRVEGVAPLFQTLQLIQSRKSRKTKFYAFLDSHSLTSPLLLKLPFSIG